MNNEIKEILDYLKDKNDYVEDFGISYKRIHIDNGDLKILLDYITNLQERIDKAIEYLQYATPLRYQDLLNILQNGSEKDG